MNTARANVLELQRNATPVSGAEHIDTIIIGGGQAGLSAAYHVSRRGVPLLVLDANERVGDSWRKRWDSLRVFTPARYDGIDGWKFPADGWHFPTKDEMGDYFEEYARKFNLTVRTGVRVEKVTRVDGRFQIATSAGKFSANNVIVATGACRTPKVPGFATQLDKKVFQMHSTSYLRPSQLQPGATLVVGTGNSGVEVSLDLSRTHQVMISGKTPPQIPVPHGSRRFRIIVRLIRFLGHHVLNLGTPIGRKQRNAFLHMATPLIRTRMQDLAAAGVQHVARIAGVKDGRPLLEDGRVLDVANVIWCTGYREDYSWIDLPIFDDKGAVVHHRGVATGAPGLYFVGMKFQYAVSSDVLPGVGRDARYIVEHLARQAAQA